MDTSVIFLGGDSVCLFEGPEKVVIPAKAAHSVHLRNRITLLNVSAAQIKSCFDDITVNSLPGSFFEFTDQMMAADIKFLLQSFQTQFFGQMIVNVGKHFIQRKSVISFILQFFSVGIFQNADFQHQCQKHLDRGLFQYINSKTELLVRQ